MHLSSSYLSAPLFLDTDFSGSLNQSGVDLHGVSELDGALLELYTTAAEAAIRQAERHRSARTTATELRTALTSRAVIDQAKGNSRGGPARHRRRGVRPPRGTFPEPERQAVHRR